MTTAGAHHGPAAPELKFEPSELVSFQADDRSAGEAIGKLLGMIFCVLLFLMITVSIWTVYYKSQTNDPMELPHAAAGGH